MKRNLLVIYFFLIPVLLVAQAKNDRPKMGLALSGGGAKGLAHIGLLMAIDSAGINIDYVAGTSMGAIVGGLYAAGYTGEEIAKFARDLNWNRILNNKPDYSQLTLPYKEDSRQFVDIPLIDGQLHFGRGMLESNELWLWLSTHFAPYNSSEVDFMDLPRPFRCVATRWDNGDAVILRRGNLVKAIRASMAIPSVFTPVDLDGLVLVDGGLVKNLPVDEVIDMGADFVISSSVTDPQLTNEDQANLMDIISQIAFYGEKRDYAEQVAASDIFVDYPIEKYHAGSFSSANTILEIGIKKGREILPKLIRIKDSLDALYGLQETYITRPEAKKIKIKEITVKGLESKSRSFFVNQMNLKENSDYTDKQISNKVKNSFATGIFRKINYSYTLNPDSTANLNLDFKRDYRTYVRAGLGYNAETGLGIKLGLSGSSNRSLFSTSSVGVSIGENPQFAARNLHFFGRTRNLFLESSITGELGEFNIFNQNLASTGIFRQNHLSGEANLIKLLNRNFQIGFGSRWEHLTYKPEIQSAFRPRGRTSLLNSYFSLKYNDQDAPYNPRVGDKILLEIGWTDHLRSGFKYRPEDSNTGIPVPINDDDHLTVRYYSAHYKPAGRHVLYLKANAGMHFGNQFPFLNGFMVGGNHFVARNQIVFPGFRLNGINTSSAMTAQAGIRLNIISKFSIATGPGILWYDFINENFTSRDESANWVGGYHVTAGYDSIIGPIEVTFMYNTLNARVTTTFNVGYSMNFSN